MRRDREVMCGPRVRKALSGNAHLFLKSNSRRLLGDFLHLNVGINASGVVGVWLNCWKSTDFGATLLI